MIFQLNTILDLANGKPGRHNLLMLTVDKPWKQLQDFLRKNNYKSYIFDKYNAVTRYIIEECLNDSERISKSANRFAILLCNHMYIDLQNCEKIFDIWRKNKDFFYYIDQGFTNGHLIVPINECGTIIYPESRINRDLIGINPGDCLKKIKEWCDNKKTTINYNHYCAVPIKFDFDNEYYILDWKTESVAYWDDKYSQFMYR